MAVVEILGDKMHKVFKELDIKYAKTYSKRCNPKKNHDPHYEVYEISQNDMRNLKKFSRCLLVLGGVMQGDVI